MSSRNSTLETTKQRRKTYVWVFVVFLLIHMFIFRGVIASIPSIMRGQSVVVRDELVPFYHFDSQFISENSASLTSSDEVRVVYSFWTAWVRYYKILPFALVLLNAVSAFILFHALFKIGRYFSRQVYSVGLAAAASAFVFHFILLYAKVTHFYTLIFGFGLFAWSLSLVLEQLFFKKKLSRSKIAAISLIVLLNPAIHYHIIFYLTFAILVFLHTLAIFIGRRTEFRHYLKRNVIYLVTITALSLIPYVLFIGWATHSTASSVSTQIPVNYWMIYYASIGLPFIFSFDTAGPIDMFQHGNYIVPKPRLTPIVFSLLIYSIFFLRQWRQIRPRQKAFVLAIFIAMLLAIWMSLGYSSYSSFSFHFILRYGALLIANLNNLPAHLASKAIATFINILRFPHRFQFIYFYFAAVLLTVVLLWIKETIYTKINKQFIAVVAVIALVLLPLFGNTDYRTALLSGNFNTFLAPYHISPDLDNIKTLLSHQPNGKLFVLPTLESGREILVDDHSYSFLDKFFIYYLNRSTFYYGTGASTQNKIIAALVYKAIDDNKQWWPDVLDHDLGVTYILRPKHTAARTVGFAYMPEVDEHIETELKQNKKIKIVYNGNDFALYQIANRSVSNKQVLIDMSWQNLRAYLNDDQIAGSSVYFPLQINNFTKQTGQLYLATDSVERSFYNLFAEKYNHQRFFPDTNEAAFSQDTIPSSQFTNIALGIGILDNKRDSYNYFKERLPSLVNLPSAQFIGMAAGSGQVGISFTTHDNGTYRLSTHIASRADELTATLGSQKVKLRKIVSDRSKSQDSIDFSYYTADVDLAPGQHKLIIQNDPKAAILVESLVVIPVKNIPRDFETPSLRSSFVSISPGANKDLYMLVFQGQNND